MDDEEYGYAVCTKAASIYFTLLLPLSVYSHPGKNISHTSIHERLDFLLKKLLVVAIIYKCIYSSSFILQMQFYILFLLPTRHSMSLYTEWKQETMITGK